MRLWLLSLVSIGLLSIALEEGRVNGIPFSGVTPNLSTGWFHKTGPTEGILFGLMVLKVLALRMAGVIPYNLNDLMAEGNFLDNQLKSWRRRKSSRSARDVFLGSKVKSQGIEQSDSEMDILERLLMGLRRIDSHDCFLKHLCHMKQRDLKGKATTSDLQILKIFALKKRNGEGCAWNLYREALHPQPMSCSAKFRLCPLEKKDFGLASILKGLF